MDEVDAIFDGGSGTDASTRVVAVLTREMDHTDENQEAAVTVVVADTNRPWCIATCLMRDGIFDRCVHTPLIYADGRARIEWLYARKIERIPLAASALEEVMRANAAEVLADADISGVCRRTSVTSNTLRSSQCSDINKMFMIY